MPGVKRKRQLTCEEKAAICKNKALPKRHPDKKTNAQLSSKYGVHSDCIRRIVRTGKGGKDGTRDPVLYYEAMSTIKPGRCRSPGGGKKMSNINKLVYPILQKKYKKKKERGDSISGKSNHNFYGEFGIWRIFFMNCVKSSLVEIVYFSLKLYPRSP